jgi:hypothetical protein
MHTLGEYIIFCAMIWEEKPLPNILEPNRALDGKSLICDMAPPARIAL